MTDKTNWAEALAQVTKRQEEVGKERDKLDELIDELNMLKWDCTEAYDSLQDARDALSRLV